MPVSCFRGILTHNPTGHALLFSLWAATACGYVIYRQKSRRVTNVFLHRVECVLCAALQIHKWVLKFWEKNPERK